MPMLKKSVLAIALAFPVAAMAQSTKELKKEVEELKARIQQLERLVEDKISAPAPAPAPAPVAAPAPAVAPAPAPVAETVDPAEFNRIRVKVEAMEDAKEASGFNGLKISGYIDPTYIYNVNQRSGSAVFLNNFTDINGSGETYTYDNSYFGGALLSIEKELEGGTKWKLALMPHKSAGSGINFGSIVHEASVSVPLWDSNTKLFAGQVPDWSGYEYYFANQTKLITHNLLFDFTIPTTYTGAGLEFISGKWDIKTMIGNLNNARNTDTRNKTPGFFYRVDYAKGEFSGFGFAGVHSALDSTGAVATDSTTGVRADSTKARIDSFEVDGYFTRGDVTLQGQIGVGRARTFATNGGNATWWGISTLAAYKFAPRFEAVARADYINNHRNGGGIFGATTGNCNFNDGSGALVANDTVDCQNGFGVGQVQDSNGIWVPGDPNKGANRAALSLGLNYTYSENVMFKGEYRYDWASLNVFGVPESDPNQGFKYRKDNHVFGVSTVVSF